MEQVTILNKMAKYDFKAPINVTMIFEDSDDDTNIKIDDSSSVSINKEAQHLNIDQDNNNTVKESRKSIGKHYNLCEVNNNSLKPESLSSRESRKRKLEDPKVTYTVDEILDQYENLNQAYQQKCSEVNKNHNENQVQRNNLQKPPDTCLKFMQSEQMSNKINGSLVMLSKNLIIIMDSYYQMQTQLRSIKDANIRKKSQDAFLYIRKYFLCLSYDILDALILPQENNNHFINSFLDNTVHRAIHKKGIKCDRRHVYLFYKYMLQWAKLQKERKNRLLQQNINGNNTLLKQHLNKPPMQVNPPANVPKVNHCTDNSYIFSSGPPGREISISVYPGALNKGNARNGYQPQSCNSMPTTNKYRNRVIPDNRTPVINTNNYYQSPGYNETPRETVSANHYQARSRYDLSQNAYHPVSSSRPTPQYSVRQDSYYHNTNYYQQTMSTQLPAQNQVYRTRSTESSESGYVSPSYGSPIMNPIDGVRSQAPTVLTPVISCPNWPACNMCGKITEYRCSICNTYYCSTFCMQLDSQYHQAMCKRS